MNGNINLKFSGNGIDFLYLVLYWGLLIYNLIYKNEWKFNVSYYMVKFIVKRLIFIWWFYDFKIDI